MSGLTFLELQKPERRRQPTTVTAKRSAYTGAGVTRLTTDWITSILTADDAIRRSLTTLRARSRDLAQNSALGARFLQMLRTHIVGPEGIKPQVRLYSTRGKLNKTANAAIEAAWDDFGRPGMCTEDARMSMVDLQEMFATTMATDGEFLAEEVNDPSLPHGMCLRVIDPELLDIELNLDESPSGGPIVMGVELDARRRPAFYHIWSAPKHGAQRATRRRVPAALIYHEFLVTHAGQTRGVPWFAPVLLVMRYDEGYLEAELAAARAAAANPIFFESDIGGPDLTTDEDGSSQPWTQDLEPLTATALPPGSRANIVDPKHPTSAFAEFRKAVHMAIAAGFGVSYTGLTGDLGSVNYSSGRIGLLDERDHWKRLQRFTIEHFLQRLYGRWLLFSDIKRGVSLPSAPPVVVAATRWQPRGWQWIDPANELEAAERELKLGLTSRTRLAGAKGVDFEDVCYEIQAENELAAELGIDVSGTEKPTAGRPPNEETPEPATDDPPKPEPEAESDRAQRMRLRALP